MTDEEEITLAKKLPKGAARALLAMGPGWVLPGRDTFNANAAFNLSWWALKHGGLVHTKIINGRRAYYTTPLGERIRHRLASAMSAGTAETEGLRAKPASAVREAETPK